MDYEDELRAIARSNEWFTSVLRAVRDVDLANWAVAAGVIRNLVWDRLHGLEEPTPVKDVDVAFFDVADVSRERDKRMEESLTAKLPDVPWEVTNQAGVHLWYETKFGHPISPVRRRRDIAQSRDGDLSGSPARS